MPVISPAPRIPWGTKRTLIESLFKEDPRRSPEEVKAIMAARDTGVSLDYVKDIINHVRKHEGISPGRGEEDQVTVLKEVKALSQRVGGLDALLRVVTLLKELTST